MFSVGGADAAMLAPEFYLLEANALADQLPFKAWGCGARAIADTIRSVATRMSLPGGRLATVIAQSRRNFG